MTGPQAPTAAQDLRADWRPEQNDRRPRGKEAMSRRRKGIRHAPNSRHGAAYRTGGLLDQLSLITQLYCPGTFPMRRRVHVEWTGARYADKPTVEVTTWI